MERTPLRITCSKCHLAGSRETDHSQRHATGRQVGGPWAWSTPAVRGPQRRWWLRTGVGDRAEAVWGGASALTKYRVGVRRR